MVRRRARAPALCALALLCVAALCERTAAAVAAFTTPLPPPPPPALPPPPPAELRLLARKCCAAWEHLVYNASAGDHVHDAKPNGTLILYSPTAARDTQPRHFTPEQYCVDSADEYTGIHGIEHVFHMCPCVAPYTCVHKCCPAGMVMRVGSNLRCVASTSGGTWSPFGQLAANDSTDSFPNVTYEILNGRPPKCATGIEVKDPEMYPAHVVDAWLAYPDGWIFQENGFGILDERDCYQYGYFFQAGRAERVRGHRVDPAGYRVGRRWSDGRGHRSRLATARPPRLAATPPVARHTPLLPRRPPLLFEMGKFAVLHRTYWNPIDCLHWPDHIHHYTPSNARPGEDTSTQ
ncbi:Protein of unknown function [Gryllus bimaculatus]|nr:Protein of unknown function [Gryllus bimaculatus]